MGGGWGSNSLGWQKRNIHVGIILCLIAGMPFFKQQPAFSPSSLFYAIFQAFF